MPQVNQMLGNRNGGLLSFADNLVVFGIQTVQAGIYNIIKILP